MNANSSDKPFANIVGQENIKPMLEYYIDSNRHGNPLPSFMLIAPKGCGKTTIAKELARHLVSSDGSVRNRRLINCAAIKNLKSFFEGVIVPHVNDRDVTIVLDEASEIPKDVSMALLTMLNPNKSRKNSFSYDDYEVEIDFHRQTFIFATTDPDQVHTALMDRTKRIDLEEYTLNDIGQMIRSNVDIDDDVVLDVAGVCRGNARNAYQYSEDIFNFLDINNSSSLNGKLWDTFKKIQNILPLGLSRIELSLLRLLSTAKEMTLTRLTAATGLSATALRRDIELYLMKMGLMEIVANSRRSITSKGQDYLKKLEEAK